MPPTKSILVSRREEVLVQEIPVSPLMLIDADLMLVNQSRLWLLPGERSRVVFS
jgi:hypothetical protein